MAESGVAHYISQIIFTKETNAALVWSLILPGTRPVFTRKLCLGGGGRAGFDLPLTGL